MNQHQNIAQTARPKDSSGSKPLFFQPKLTVNQPNDVYEQEADAMADKVMRMPVVEHQSFFRPSTGTVNRKCAYSDEEEKLKQNENSALVRDAETVSIPPQSMVQRIPVPGSSSSLGQSVLNQQTTVSAARRQPPQGVISRAEFASYVSQYFGVPDVHDGTQQEQEQPFTLGGAAAVTLPNWQAWGLPDQSADYSLIIKAIEDVAGTFLAVPNINKIVFFRLYYERRGNGVVERPDAGASFSNGALEIYQAFSGSHVFPVARSNAQGIYPHVGIASSGPGSNTGAPSEYLGRESNIRQNITHELGHGIGEAAHVADPDVYINFNNTVGWVTNGSPALYDIGQAAVRAAITAHTTPPSQYHIQPGNWNDPRWIEQPMTNYSVDGGPGEDFAESITAFVYSRAVLQARSPRRYQYILNGITSWTAQMRAMPRILPPSPVGDFPESPTLQHTA